MSGQRLLPTLALACTIATASSGCTRRQLVPAILAGTGAAMTTSGGIYRATLDTDEPFGETTGEVAGTTILIFGGAALLITGIVWSITSSSCDSNSDCWSGDVCELRSHTCIDGAAARQLRYRRPSSDEEGESDDEEGESDDEEGESDDEEGDEYVPPPYPG